MPSVLAQAAARALQWRFAWGQAPGAPAALWNCAISELGRLGGHGWALPKMGTGGRAEEPPTQTEASWALPIFRTR